MRSRTEPMRLKFSVTPMICDVVLRDAPVLHGAAGEARTAPTSAQASQAARTASQVVAG